MTDALVLVPCGLEFLALTPAELAQARDRAREALGAGWGADRGAAAVTQSPEELLTAQQMEAVTRIPAPWYLESARRREIPHVRLGRYPRFLLSKVVEHGLVTPPGEGAVDKQWTRRQKGKRAGVGSP